jgi:integrase
MKTQVAPEDTKCKIVGRRPRPTTIGYGGGLALQLTPGKVAADGTYSVAHSWLWRCYKDGKTVTRGLGSFPEVSINKARVIIETGIHPQEARAQERQEVAKVAQAVEAKQAEALKFKDAAVRFFEEVKAKEITDPRYPKQWKRQLETYIFPAIGDLSVAEITVTHVKDCLLPIWTPTDPEMAKTSNKKRKGKAGIRTAEILCRRVAEVLNWALPDGMVNPASWQKLKHKLPSARKGANKTVHHRPAVKVEDIQAFFAQLKQVPFVGARALEFLILTGARSKEVRLAKWKHVDLKARTWYRPAENMKKRVEDTVPLSDAAFALVEMFKGSGEPDDPEAHIFTGWRGRPVSTMLKIAQDIDPNICVHGFRSTIRDWCGDIAENISWEVSERILAHKVGNDTANAYRRGKALEKRRAALEQWADFCCQPPAEVISIDSRKVA